MALGLYFNAHLMRCIEQHKNTEIQALFQNHDPSDLVDDYGQTLLHHAVCKKNDPMTRYFIDRGCDVDARDNQGNTPLMHAVNERHRPSIEILLDAGADIFLCNRNDENIFQLIVKYLSVLGASTVDKIVEAGKRRYLNDVRALAGKLIEMKLSFPHAMLFRDTNLTKYMLEHGCAVNECDDHGNTALNYAVALADLEHVKMLIENGIDATIKYDGLYGPLYFYNTESEDTDDKLEILTILMDLGATLPSGTFGNCMLETTLFRVGSKELIETLLQWDVDFNAKDEENRTLVHFMSCNDKPGILDLLRDIPFDVNLRDIFNRNTVWYAASNCNWRVLRFLLENGAEVNGLDAAGRPVLFYGLDIWPTHRKREDSIRCLELLLRYKADAQYVRNGKESFFHRDFRKVTCFEPFLVVIAHLTMMEAFGKPISDFVVNRIRRNRVFDHYLRVCRRQIQRYRAFRVHGSITLFDILTESPRGLTLRLRNPRVAIGLELLMWEIRKTRFLVDHYRRNYWGRVIEARRCAELREHAGRTIARVAGINYDHCITDGIIAYLDSRDLQNLCLTNFEEV